MHDEKLRNRFGTAAWKASVTLSVLLLTASIGLAALMAFPGTSIRLPGETEAAGGFSAEHLFFALVLVAVLAGFAWSVLRSRRRPLLGFAALYLVVSLLLGFSVGGPHLTYGVPVAATVVVLFLYSHRVDPGEA